MNDSLTYSIRDLVPHSDLSERPGERELRLHHVAQAQLRRKYKTFKPEVTLSATLTVGGREVTVRGRLDGYRRTAKGILLYEIKTVPGEPRSWAGHPLLQNARWQLQLYADLVRASATTPWGDAPLAEGILCLVGANQKLSMESVDLRASTGMLEERLNVLLAGDRPWRTDSDATLAAIREFAAEDAKSDRPGQREANQLLESAQRDSRILLSMPPGSGKTRVALRYALQEAFARNMRLYWITAKARGRDEVFAELERYRLAGIPLRVLWKTIPERLCDCANPGYTCPRRLETRTALFFDTLSELRERSSWSFADVRNFARSRAFCLHELCGVVERDADVIIADVNYILNPSRLFAHEAVMVLDEAQNMAQRVYDNSQIRIRRDELLGLLHAVPQSVRSTVRQILSARSAEEDGGASLQESIQALRDQTSRLQRLPAISAIRRMSRLLADLPDDFAVTWSRAGADPELIGTIVDARRTMENALSSHPWVLALSGSLPADPASRLALFQVCDQFTVVESQQPSRAPVYIVPELIFKYPLSAEDHATAVELLRELRGMFPPSIAVFGQNRASNEVLAMALRVRGFTVLLDEDLGNEWETALAAMPDFIFVAIGGTLSEAVNPPSQLFSAAAILSPAYRAPDEFDLLRSTLRSGRWDVLRENSEDVNRAERRAEAVSRVIQAAGRLQRSPDSQKPVFLLNRDFADSDYLRAWPRGWYRKSPQELVFPSLEAVQEHIIAASHEE